MIINNEFYGLHSIIDYSEYVFRLYNPLTCDRDSLSLPQPYPNTIFDVIKRARHILEKRDFDGICFAVNQLHEMNAIIIYGLPEENCIPKYSEDYIVPFFDYMTTFNISQLDEFPDATWAEFFAVSALICVGIILESFDRDDKTYEQSLGLEDAADWEFTAFEAAIHAAEAIAYAESLIYINTDIDKKVKNKISLKNRNAANIRHSSKNAIKNEFIESYNKSSGSSKADSAKKFFNKLPEEKKKHFRDEVCAVRSLLEHQRKYSK